MKERLIRVGKKVGYFLVGGLIGLVVFAGIAYGSFSGKILPNVWVGSVSVGGLEKGEAVEKVRGAVGRMEVSVEYGDYEFKIRGEDFGYRGEESVKRAYREGRDWRRVGKILTTGLEVEPLYRESFSGFVATASAAVKVKPVRPRVRYEKGEIVVENGQDGVEVERDKLLVKIREAGEEIESRKFEMPTRKVNGSLSQRERESLKKRAEKLLGDSLGIRFEGRSFKLGEEELVGFLATDPGGEALDEEKVKSYVAGLSESVEREPVNARFQFEGGKIAEFRPDRKGVRVKKEKSEKRIKEAMRELLGEEEEAEVELAVVYEDPEITTGEVNNLGIEERIGRGESYYRHSIPSRMYNLELTARKLDGVLVPPGEVFSFNGSLGEVSAVTGFKSAYIIKDGRTQLGDGGGVCQDSTTAFRAALDAGLPIVERWAHGYRVSYYEQNAKPGLDATVYAPSKDLKFKNNTGAHILIDTWYESDRRHLVYDIYGRDDGREVYISPVRVWDVTPPPPPLYQDDPSLPEGTVKQVDWAAWGAKTEFDYEVKKDGEVIFSESFYSNFIPWQDVYLRGTGE